VQEQSQATCHRLLGPRERHGRFPTGGWGFAWTGDADQGNDWRQPAGWLYNVLPFIEQQALHDMGAGMTSGIGGPKYAAHMQRMSVPLAVMYCPTRRQAVAYPWACGHGVANAATPTVAGRSDYAGNGGSVYTSPQFPYSPLWASYMPDNMESGPASIAEVENPPWQMTANARTTFRNIAQRPRG